MAFDPDKQLPGGPGDANEAFLDALIRHQIYLLRFSGSLRNEVTAILNATEEDLANTINNRLKSIGAGATTANLKKLQKLQILLNAIRNKAWDKVSTLMRKELVQLSQAEPRFTDNSFRAVSVVTAATTLPAASALRSLALTQPFEGRVLSEWVRGMRRTDLANIKAALNTGLVQGENINQLTRRVIGTTRLLGSDGVTELTRRQVASIVRTAVNSISNQSKRAYYKLNEDIYNKELYVATLDGRTTVICGSLDGKLFNIGVGPIPPLHFNCRSLRVAVLDAENLSDRAAVATTEKGMLRDFTQQNGLRNVGSRTNLPRGFKGAYDTFKRGRLRELTGQVPGKLSYSEFFRRQSVGFQNDVLGKTKATLYRQGNLTLDKFVNRQGDELTLSQLAKKEKKAFKQAGLDTKDFI